MRAHSQGISQAGIILTLLALASTEVPYNIGYNYLI